MHSDVLATICPPERDGANTKNALISTRLCNNTWPIFTFLVIFFFFSYGGIALTKGGVYVCGFIEMVGKVCRTPLQWAFSNLPAGMACAELPR